MVDPDSGVLLLWVGRQWRQGHRFLARSRVETVSLTIVFESEPQNIFVRPLGCVDVRFLC